MDTGSNLLSKEFLDKLHEAAEKDLPTPSSYVGMGSEIYEHLAKMCLKGKLRVMPLSRTGADDRGFIKSLINNCYGLSLSDDKWHKGGQPLWWSVDDFPPVKKTSFNEDAFIKAAFKAIMYPGRGCMRSYALRWMQYEIFYKKFITELKRMKDTEPLMNIKSVAEWNKEYVNLYFLNMKEVYKEWQDHSFCGATLAFELHLPTRTEAEAARVRTLHQMGLWFLDDITYNKKRYKGGDMMGVIHACMFRNEFDTSLPTFEPAPWIREIGSNTTILNDEYNKQSFNEKSQKWLKNKNKKGK